MHSRLASPSQPSQRLCKSLGVQQKYVCMYVYECVCISLSLYIYIYRERERDAHCGARSESEATKSTRMEMMPQTEAQR